MPFDLGIDLCDEYITAYEPEKGDPVTVPAVICREKKEDVWYIGEAAYRMALSGKGVITDKLISLLKKDGTSTISRKAYTAEQLIGKLLSTLLGQILGSRDISEIRHVCIAVREADRKIMDVVLRAAQQAGIPRERLSIISHTEAFVHYTMAQDRELYNNMAALFDLSDERLAFYRFKVVRGMSKASIIAEGGEQEESFHIDILKKEAGSVLGDRIMRDVAMKQLSGNIYSSVLLTGKGFERTDWASGFIEFVCRKRKVLYENSLFAIGAGKLAESRALSQEPAYTILCDTKLTSRISMQVMAGNTKMKLVLAESGDDWYSHSAHAEVLPDHQDYIDIDIEPIDKYEKVRTARVQMKDFPIRPNRCTRVAVDVYFDNAETMKIRLSDMGFGEIFPASDIVVEETVKL